MTYSIVAADTTTGQVGGAGTSCLEGEDVYVIYHGVPGHGVVHAQAYYSTRGGNRAAELLATGTPPDDIIAEITSAAFDRQASSRQYGIVDLLGRSAAFTGSDTLPFAGARRGEASGYFYSVQGNILTSEAVLTQAAAGFDSGGCDLAERLLNALEGGAQDQQGDSRCTPRGIPSDSAFLQIEAKDGEIGGSLSLHIQSSGEQNPLPLLRERFTVWRAEHPCPAAAPATQPAGAAGSAMGTATNDAGCGCELASAGNATSIAALLFGLLLVVARRRQRSSRQLFPPQAS